MNQLELTGVSQTVSQTVWEVDGDEVQVIGFHEEPTTTDEAIRMLQLALDCTELEARHAHRIIEEDGEFVTSVSDDIANL